MLKIYKWLWFSLVTLAIGTVPMVSAKTVIANGESVFYSNIALGCNHALNQARQKAQILAGTAKIYSFQTKSCKSNQDEAGCILDKYSSLSFDSLITQENKLKEEITSTLIQNKNIYTCEVQYEFDVEPINSYSDIFYDFTMNQETFLAPLTPRGQNITKDDQRFPDLTFNIQSNQPFYFYLYQQLNYLTDEKNIFLIYPNDIDNERVINHATTIPINEDQYQLKISFPQDVDEPSIVIPLIGIIAEEKISTPALLSFEQLGQLLLDNQSKINFFEKFYTVYKK